MTHIQKCKQLCNQPFIHSQMEDNNLGTLVVVVLYITHPLHVCNGKEQDHQRSKSHLFLLSVIVQTRPSTLFWNSPYVPILINLLSTKELVQILGLSSEIQEKFRLGEREGDRLVQGGRVKISQVSGTLWREYRGKPLMTQGSKSITHKVVLAQTLKIESGTLDRIRTTE